MNNQDEETSNSSNTNRGVLVKLCPSGCGFYGSLHYEGLCSNCFKSIRQPCSNSTINTDKIFKEDSFSFINKINSENDTYFSNYDSALCQEEEANSINNCNALESSTKSKQNNHENELVTENQDTLLTTENILVEECSTDIVVLGDVTSPKPVLDSPSEPSETRKRKHRCHDCKKSVGLLGFTCRCGGVYCSQHRYSDAHNCPVDYRASGRQDIRKSNPQIVGEKVRRI